MHVLGGGEVIVDESLLSLRRHCHSIIFYTTISKPLSGMCSSEKTWSLRRFCNKLQTSCKALIRVGQGLNYSSFGSVSLRSMKLLLPCGVPEATRYLAEASLCWCQSEKTSTSLSSKCPSLLLIKSFHLWSTYYVPGTIYSKDFTRLHRQAVQCWDSEPVSVVAESRFLTITLWTANCWQPTGSRLCMKLKAICPQRIIKTSSFCYFCQNGASLLLGSWQSP